MNKPRIGLLGLMIEGYKPLFPGICENQTKYAIELVAIMQPHAEIVFDSLATNLKEIEDTVEKYNQMKLDGIIMVMFAYSHSGWIINAMRKNRLPLALAVLQPDEIMEPKFTEYDFTINQGIHGAQDNANMLCRLGVNFEAFVGSRHSKEFSDFFADFSRAAMCVSALRTMKVAVIGKMNNMGDLFTDDVELQSKIGTEFSYENIGSIESLQHTITDEEIAERIEFEKTVFNVDQNMEPEVHAYAVRQYLAIKKFLLNGSFDAFTLHFETLGADGRFERLPFLAASNLLADGFGYAAEGDSMCASIMRIAMLMADGMATFSEMYALDYATESILMCHAGEGNWKMAAKAEKPRLLAKEFNEGGLKNPPTPLFTPEPGVATVVSFAPMGKGNYKLVAAKGQILPKNDLAGCEMPYLFFKPDCGFTKCAKQWLIEGATHHEAVISGDVTNCFRIISNMLGIQFAEL